MQPKVSIIIPVYNSKEFLAECLYSIKVQTYTDFEVLMVNDGSNDGSGGICDVFSREDNRFHAIHQKNNGVSAARNNGLNHVCGEWVLFVDSDDRVEPDYVEKYVSTIDNGIDLIYGGYKSFGEVRGGMTGYSYHDKSCGLSQISDVISMLLVYCTPWGKMFRMSVINDLNLRFEEKLTFSEDRLFIYQYLRGISGVAFFDYCGYQYRVTPGSLMSRPHSKDECVLRLQKLWVAALDIKKQWSLSLLEFMPFFEIHCGLLMSLFAKSKNPIESRLLYKTYLGRFFREEFFESNKAERKIIRRILGKKRTLFSLGYYQLARLLIVIPKVLAK